MGTEKSGPAPAGKNSVLKSNNGNRTGEAVHLAPAEVQSNLESDQWLLVDVRTAEEYRSVHIKPSVNIPLAEIGARTGEILGQGRKVVLSCHSGARASTAAKALQAAGGTELYLLEGAIDGWQKAGLPVEKSGAAFTLQRQVFTIAGVLLITGSVLTLCLESRLWVLICLWVGVGLLLAGVTGKCLMAALLLKMPWNRVVIKAPGECGGSCSR